MKKGVRLLAVVSGPLRGKNTIALGLVSRMGTIEGVVSTRVQADGTDSTAKLARLFNGTRFREQAKLIVVNGIGFAGLNVLDVQALKRKTGAEVLSITRNKPHPEELVKALRAFSKQEKQNVSSRTGLVKKIGELEEYRHDGYYVQTTLEKGESAKFVSESARLLRLAHLIASGVVLGESRGRV